MRAHQPAGDPISTMRPVDDRVGEERLLTELNARIRGVAEGPDGALYMLTDGPNGRILRLVPK
jgi:aldose sugar dehydrogenase